jgi:predicted DsbA family dithiol-disulfide isomerase
VTRWRHLTDDRYHDQQRFELDVYFDFLCPFAYQGSEWLREVREQLGPDQLKITWRYFPLDQVNSTGGPSGSTGSSPMRT